MFPQSPHYLIYLQLASPKNSLPIEVHTIYNRNYTIVTNEDGIYFSYSFNMQDYIKSMCK